jgi:hypothetical protein
MTTTLPSRGAADSRLGHGVCGGCVVPAVRRWHAVCPAGCIFLHRLRGLLYSLSLTPFPGLVPPLCFRLDGWLCRLAVALLCQSAVPLPLPHLVLVPCACYVAKCRRPPSPKYVRGAPLPQCVRSAERYAQAQPADRSSASVGCVRSLLVVPWLMWRGMPDAGKASELSLRTVGLGQRSGRLFATAGDDCRVAVWQVGDDRPLGVRWRDLGTGTQQRSCITVGPS